MQASHLPAALPRHHQNPLICKCVWPLRVSDKGLWIDTGREERDATLLCGPRRLGSVLRSANAGRSWRSCFPAAPSADAPRPASVPAMDTAWAPQLHRISISLANRRRGRWRPAHLRPDRALLRFVMLASPLNPPFYFLVPLPFVFLRG